jgi:hypothetical protein
VEKIEMIDGKTIVALILLLMIPVLFFVGFSHLPAYFTEQQRNIIFVLVIGLWLLGFVVTALRMASGR